MPEGQAADRPLPARHEFESLVRRLDAAASADIAACARAAAAQTAAAPAEAEWALAGLPAALRVTALLLHHGCGWADALIGEPALAKRCGRLGSEFHAERQAAYIHALRHLAQRRRSWSAVMRAPPELCRERAGAPAHAAARSDPSPAPPERDWATTIAWLAAQRIWLDASQCAALEHLQSRVACGSAPDPAEAAWLREMWWRIELRASPPAPDA
jgi:hypothetical protein